MNLPTRRLAYWSAITIVVFPFLHFFAVNINNLAFDWRLFLFFSALIVPIAALAVILPAIIAHHGFVAANFVAIVAVNYAFFVLFFSFGFIYPALKTVLTHLGTSKGAMAAYVSTSVVLLYVVWRAAQTRAFHVVVLVFFISMTLISSGRLIIGATKRLEAISFNIPSQLTSSQEVALHGVVAHKPSVYFIVVDGYSSVRTLKEYLEFDNAPFIEMMRARGFYHAADARAAYATTYLTLAAIFDAGYPIHESSPSYAAAPFTRFYPFTLERPTPPPLIQNIKALGYDFYLVGNMWADCRGPHVQCLPNKPAAIPYEIQLFMELTPLSWFYTRSANRSSQALDAIGRTVDYLRANRFPKSPFFVFVHHLPPHPPYAFESDCRQRRGFRFDFTWSAQEVPLYLDNLRCTNKRLAELIDSIDQRNPDALVIIQGDHGSAFTVDWKLPMSRWSDRAVRERTSILNLVRAPERCRRWLTNEMNSVNTVRFLLACVTHSEPQFAPDYSFLGAYDTETPDFGKVHKVRRPTSAVSPKE
jgi:hypothetical protein